MRTVFLYISMLAVGVALLVPVHAQAQVSQLCWTEKECEAYRAKYVNTAETKDGLYQGNDAIEKCGGKFNVAGDKIGFCLPAGKAVTKISIGGRNEFANIGEFIQYIYKYGFMVATVIAVLMVMTGGAMWIFSGGNSDMITKAKSKLTGAVMGLILLGLSYSILNLVNPYLVNLRLPDIWAINTVGLAAPTCGEIPTPSTLFAEAFPQEKYKTITDKEKNELYGKVKFELTKKDTVCQKHYFTSDGKGQTCRGTVCEPQGNQKMMCAPAPTDLQKYECKPGQLILYMGVGSLWQDAMAGSAIVGQAFDILEKPEWFDHDVFSIIGICQEDGAGKRYTSKVGYESIDSHAKLESVSSQSVFTPYIIRFEDGFVGGNTKPQSAYCGTDTLIGFWLYGELGIAGTTRKDARYFIGQAGNSDTAIAGTWDMVGWNNFLSLDKLQNEGIFLKVLINQTIINKTFDNTGTWPPADSNTQTFTTVPITKENGNPDK